MRSVKIGPQRFAVKAIEKLQSEDGTDLDGHIVYSQSEIRIRAGMDDFSKLLTLWHEIAHGIFTQGGVRVEKQEEKLVEMISYGIVKVLQDNPHLREPKWS